MSDEFYTIEEDNEMHPKKNMHKVVGYDLQRRTRTIYAICHTREQAKKELAEVEAGEHGTQTEPGGTLLFVPDPRERRRR